MITTVWKKKSLKELAKLREKIDINQDEKKKEEEFEYASRSPQFERKKHKYLSDKEFQTKKPPI